MYDFHRTALRVSYINMVLNALLAALKLTTGYFAGSDAMLSDGVHSVTDVLSTVIVVVGVRLSAHRCDSKHPYGHERFECVAAVVLAMIVGTTGISIAVSSLQTVFVAETASTTMAASALLTPLLAIAVKECMFRYTKRTALKSGSSALMADAWHQRADALSSVGGFVGVLGASLGWPILDPIAGAVIGGLIVKASLDVFLDAMKKMTDRSCDEALQKAIQERILACQGVRHIEEFKTRLFGNRVYAEVTVAVDGGLSAKEAYDIAVSIRRVVDEAFDTVKDCAVHIRPL